MKKQIKIKKLREGAILPFHGSAEAAGYDLYAELNGKEKQVIGPHCTNLIGTGLAMELPKNTYLGIYARSGLATKKGLRPANCEGIIDADYRGEIMIALHNDTDDIQEIQNGERIAQCLLHNAIQIRFRKTNKLKETKRTDKGFGSTGNK